MWPTKVSIQESFTPPKYLLIWIIVRKGPTTLPVGANVIGHFSLVNPFSLWKWTDVDRTTVSKGR